MTFLFGTGVAADMGLVAHLGAPHLRIVPQPLCTPLATTGADAGSAGVGLSMKHGLANWCQSMLSGTQ